MTSSLREAQRLSGAGQRIGKRLIRREPKVVTDAKSRMYYYKTADGWGGMGWDYAANQQRAVARMLERPDLLPRKLGTIKAYKEYERVMRLGAKSGKKSDADLTPQLVGLEGKRVEVVDSDGETRRFKVGKSSGWMPVHLELANERSTGGSSAMGPYKSVKVIR